MNFKPIKFSPNKRLLKKIIKTCGSAFDFVNEYIEDSSEVSDIRRMKEYVRCVNKVEHLANKARLKNKKKKKLYEK